MVDLEFEWDAKKEKANAKKHGVSFDDARTAFYDDTAMVFHDPDHSNDEDRFILLGMSVRAGVLVVCHCIRESGSVVRIFLRAVLTNEKKLITGSIEDERPLRFFKNEG